MGLSVRGRLLLHTLVCDAGKIVVLVLEEGVREGVERRVRTD